MVSAATSVYRTTTDGERVMVFEIVMTDHAVAVHARQAQLLRLHPHWQGEFVHELRDMYYSFKNATESGNSLMLETSQAGHALYTKLVKAAQTVQFDDVLADSR